MTRFTEEIVKSTESQRKLLKDQVSAGFSKKSSDNSILSTYLEILETLKSEKEQMLKHSKSASIQHLKLIDESVEILTEIVKSIEEASKTTLMYGSKGVLQFLASLFSDFDSSDKDNVNYYFTIREQMIEHTAQMAYLNERAVD